MRVLFSVYNISGYLLAELEALSVHAQIFVIETPCNIKKGKLESKVKWIDRRKIKKIKDIDEALGGELPDIYFCGGWSDRIFLNYARWMHASGKKTVLAIDTPWKGTLRQWIHCVISRFTLIPRFDYAWGAGEPQRQHLLKLGFSISSIRTGYYCADTKKFLPIGENRITRCKEDKNWPHVMLYIGRYIAVKNMRRMERAFIKASEGTDWKLVCIGRGELWNERTIHPRIEHLGYKQPNEIQEYVSCAGCFVLPSIYEPWGVVVHEAALMGLPLLCSKHVNSATKYLKDGANGFNFNPVDEASIIDAFRKIIDSSDESLYRMGEASLNLGRSYIMTDWVNKVQQFAY